MDPLTCSAVDLLRRNAHRQVVLFALSVPALMACLGLVGCSHTLQDYFDDHDYAYPLHIDRRERLPELVVPEGDIAFDHRENACRRSPDDVAFLRRSVALLREEVLYVIARSRCPRARAFLLTDPFVIMYLDSSAVEGSDKPHEVKHLGMRIECYGEGDLAPGIAPHRAFGGLGENRTNRLRAEDVEQKLDGWPVHRLGDRRWAMWNVAIFRISADAAEFVSFLRHYDPDVASQLYVPEFTDPLSQTISCGRRLASGVQRESY